ncbi:MAG: hypothetical protein O7F12_04070 [Nitrospirae bacterium]|nr:hypothetical protein [Nitrospirota bacterium]
MPNSTQPDPQSKPFRLPEPVRVLPLDPDCIDITTPIEGYRKIDIKSTFSRGRDSYNALRFLANPDGTFELAFYGDSGDRIMTIHSDHTGALDIVLTPKFGNSPCFWIPLDKILFDYLKLAPRGGEW